MSTERQKAVVRRFVEEMLNGQNLAVAEELFTADFVDHDADDPDGRRSGVEGARAEVGVFLSAFPDMRVTADQLIAEGDTVVYRGTVSGTQTGEFFGIPPTGKRVTVTGIHIVRIADGKVAEHWSVRDDLGQITQLGLISKPQSSS